MKPESTNPSEESMYDRFCRGAKISIENWRDPQHDLEAIRLASELDRQRIESFLLRQGIRNYTDVEALAILKTPESNAALLNAFRHGKPEIRAAVVHLSPELIHDEERLSELIHRIATCDAYQGLDLTLRQIEQTHPQEVIKAMLKRIAVDPGVAAVHFAALLCFLFGNAKEAFDWDHRPFFLRFNPGDEADRKGAFADLCAKIGCSPDEYFS